MEIITWNVNGIRAALKKGFADFLAREKPEVICLQETKIGDSAREKAQFDFSGFEEYWHSAERPGYSGTAVFVSQKYVKSKVHKVISGIGIPEFDREGRVQTVEFEDFFLVNAYFPNSNDQLSRLPYKLKFNEAILKYLEKLRKIKPVMICGDFNVAHKEIDLARPKDNVKNAGFTPQERVWVDKLVKKCYVDLYRDKYPDRVQYTWWTYRFGARSRNVGWRIDYFFSSDDFAGRVKEVEIMDQVMGSDHCPVRVVLK